MSTRRVTREEAKRKSGPKKGKLKEGCRFLKQDGAICGIPKKKPKKRKRKATKETPRKATKKTPRKATKKTPRKSTRKSSKKSTKKSTKSSGTKYTVMVPARLTVTSSGRRRKGCRKIKGRVRCTPAVAKRLKAKV